jgi:regulator of RNase E activity RraA
MVAVISIEDRRDVAARLSKVPTCTIVDILPEHPIDKFIMKGVGPIQFADGIVAGPARTLRFLPSRPDFAASVQGQANFKLIDAVEPGDVLVFDTMGGLGGSVLGDMLALGAVRRGAAAVVTDGAVRDLAGLHTTGLTVYAGRVWPIPFRGTLVPWEADKPIQCGGALVLPGDWIVADRDAALALPAELVPTILERAASAAREEDFSRRLLERGHSLQEAFPIKATLRPHYERFLENGVLPSEEEVREAGRSVAPRVNGAGASHSPRRA